MNQINSPPGQNGTPFVPKRTPDDKPRITLEERKILREIVKRVHGMYLPPDWLTVKELDKMIDQILTGETMEAYLNAATRMGFRHKIIVSG